MTDLRKPTIYRPSTMRDRSGDKRTLAKPDRLLPWSNTSTAFFWISLEQFFFELAQPL